jgi:hypothetical protein
MAQSFKGFDASAADAVQPKSSVKKVSKVFAPGLHTVKITNVEEKGAVPNDSTWQRLWITYEGTGGKVISGNLLYPTESMSYNGQENSFPAQQFLGFVQAIGLVANGKTLQTVLTRLFSEPSEALLGKELQVSIGYTANHVKPEGNQFSLFQKYGRAVTVDGVEQKFNTREAAAAYCQENGLKFVSFPDITEFIKAENLEVLGAASVNKAPVAKKSF